MKPMLLAAGLVLLAGSPALAQGLAGTSNIAGLGVSTHNTAPAGSSHQATTAAGVSTSHGGNLKAIAVTGDNVPASGGQTLSTGNTTNRANPADAQAVAGVKPTTAGGGPNGAIAFVNAGATHDGTQKGVFQSATVTAPPH